MATTDMHQTGAGGALGSLGSAPSPPDAKPTGAQPGTGSGPPRRGRAKARMLQLFGPAFVAAVAYVDPGNVAANLTAGSRYGYTLVWVLVMANAMAVLVQYLSAKLGIATGQSLPQMLAARLPKWGRYAFFGQAEIIAIATDLAEVIGGAVALHLLFGLPLALGGVITGGVSLALLAVQSKRGQRPFELIITAMLVIITIGFVSGLVISPVSPAELIEGLVPRFQGTDSVLLAASMLGATVMPHAVYLHSSLTRDRHGPVTDPAKKRHLIRVTRWDVLCALVVAGSVNIAMLVLAAANLRGVAGTDSIEGAHAAIAQHMGPAVGVVFAVGLLFSGLASTSVGSYAGAEIIHGFLRVRLPVMVVRLVTLIPAIAVLLAGASPSWILVLSQVVLSFGIPFAIIPLVYLTGKRSVMGDSVNSHLTAGAAWLTTVLIVALNLGLVYLTLAGH
ncbi:MAG: Nramp family divalent metal transporter [Bifidobacteriaceae bacterium]|jgi:manganese transport protein|nr:Nramp family divalent metal transporter [Bifidobacteriaceae bacterium]